MPKMQQFRRFAFTFLWRKKPDTFANVESAMFRLLVEILLSLLLSKLNIISYERNGSF